MSLNHVLNTGVGHPGKKASSSREAPTAIAHPLLAVIVGPPGALARRSSPPARKDTLSGNDVVENCRGRHRGHGWRCGIRWRLDGERLGRGDVFPLHADRNVHG